MATSGTGGTLTAAQTQLLVAKFLKKHPQQKWFEHTHLSVVLT
jgi:hypothetical protein